MFTHFKLILNTLTTVSTTTTTTTTNNNNNNDNNAILDNVFYFIRIFEILDTHNLYKWYLNSLVSTS